MKLRQRTESIKYASDSEEDDSSIASDQNVVVMNQRRRKVKAASNLSFSDNGVSGSLLRFAQPNVKNTSADLPPLPELSIVVDDSDEDFMEARVSQRKRTTSQVSRKGGGSPQAKRNISGRSVRKSYKEGLGRDEVQKVLVSGQRRLVKAVASPKAIEQSPCEVSEDDTNAHSDAEASKLCRPKRVLPKKACTSITEQDSTKTEANISPSVTDVEDAQEPMALDLHVDAYGLCTLEGASACKMVKCTGQIEKILAVQNQGTNSVVYCIKECGRSYRSVCAVKEALLKSKCPQLLRNFLKRMDELERLNGNPGDREDAPAFNYLYLQVERVICLEERRGGRRYYLVKWGGLPYTESTWELEADLIFKEDQAAIARYFQINSRTSLNVPLTNNGKLLFKDGRELRDYQEKGLAWMDHNFQIHVNCILADEMGLGKTMQAVSMLENLRVKRKCKGPFLVIAPVSTLGHWQREVESLTNMNCVLFSGSAEDRRIIKNYEFFYAKSQYIKFNVLLTSFEILMKDQGFLSKHEWQYVVVDEAHRLKSKCSKTTCCLKQLSIRRGGLLLLTGTPIQNNTKEVFSLLNILDPQQFSSEEEFLLKYGDLKKAEQVKDLQDNVLRPRLLRRLKEDVEKSIPLKEETIIWVELTKEQRCYYRAILENRISDLLKGSQSNNIPNLRNVAMELRKLCNHPFLCNGLQEDIVSKLKLQEVDKTSAALSVSSGKMMLLDKLLPMLKNAGHRVLLFSQFAIMLDLLEDYLISKSYTYERIDGSVRGSERQAAIDRYSSKDSDTFLFLLSTRAGGLGITLTAADTCIIYDSDWNPQNDLQAMARCHRIGQKKDVRIYRLITKDTYEQHLFECSSRKYGLDEAILGGMQGAITDNEYNENIENLLKKGAYSILREDGEAEAAAFHAQNIEQILESRTEKRLVGGRGQNTFSVATFISNPAVDSVLDEEPASDGDPQQFWQELLPEACNAALNDDKTPMVTSCGPRKRQVVNYREGRGISETESSDEGHGISKSRRHRARKKNSEELGANGDIKQWSEKELKQLENSLLELGANRAEEIMAEAGLQHHGIQEVQQLMDVLFRLCHYFQARSAIATNSSHAKPLDVQAAPDQSFVKDQLAPNGNNCCTNQTQSWKASTFSDMPGEGPASVDAHFQQDNKDMKIDGEEKPESPNVVMHPVIEGIVFPTIPPYAQKALRSQVFTKRLEKRAARYLQVLQERETLARALCEGTILPPYVKRLKRLPIWWNDAEDADLLRGAHKHGHRSFYKIREDKSLCFSSKLELLNSGNQKREDPPCQDAAFNTIIAENQQVASNVVITDNPPIEPFPCPDQEVWPQDGVLAMRLRQLIQALRTPLPLQDRHKGKVLEETAPKSSVDERGRAIALVSKMHPRYESMPPQGLLSASASLRQPSMELCGRNIVALSPNAEPQKSVTAVGPLPIIKTKPPHALPIIKSKTFRDHKSRGKENLHCREVLDVPNTSSEGSGDEFQRQYNNNSKAAQIVDRQWATNMGGASRLDKPYKGGQGPGNVSITRSEIGSTPLHKEQNAKPILLSGSDISSQQESRGKKWPATSTKSHVDYALDRTNQREPLLELKQSREKKWPSTSTASYKDFALERENWREPLVELKQRREKKGPSTENVSHKDFVLERANQRETLLELNSAKRKTFSEAPLLSNKKHKEASKQQTLHGFLAQRVVPKQGIP
ncbi:hypothetical protein GOP47_0010194 [Adiantum capillus-veneris]|uniref:Uncharacterized protein n=1 Tax=Adiantum capillus-veneris TaxID=13818 RepID=A0A9D4UUA9_ADICA|nr:hypothetical protein GOP47_0010194 [Adiantum capillus-veneris]